MEISNLSLKSLRNYKTLEPSDEGASSTERQRPMKNREDLATVDLSRLPPNTSIKAYMNSVKRSRSPNLGPEQVPIVQNGTAAGQGPALQDVKKQYYQPSSNLQSTLTPLAKRKLMPVVQQGVLDFSDLASSDHEHDEDELDDSKKKYHRNETKAKYTKRSYLMMKRLIFNAWHMKAERTRKQHFMALRVKNNHQLRILNALRYYAIT